jgi:glycosyltransferase involved in cell wall biosynthesis
LRAGLIIYGSIDTPTGGYLYDRMLVRTLEARGHEVEIVSQERRQYLDCIQDNFSREMLEKLECLDVDVLIEDELNHISLFHLNSRLKEKASYPLVSIVHHLSCSASRDPKERYMYRYFEEMYLRTIDGFVFNSKATMGSVTDVLERGLKGIVAHPGKDHIDLSITRPMIEKETEPFEILYIGNVLPHKGLDVLIEALSAIEYHNWRLRVIGRPLDDEFMEKVAGLVSEGGLESRVRFMGFVTDDQLRECLNAGHILCVPSFFEGYGIVYAEALGHGLPVIASTSGGAGEMISEGEDGFLIGPGNVGQLAGFLELLMNDNDLLQRMSERALEKFEKLPTWEESMGSVIDFLLSTVD